MPVFIGKYNEIRQEKAKVFDDDTTPIEDLLGTIKVPRNLKLLAGVLPKSNYGKKKNRSESIKDLSTESDSNHNTNDMINSDALKVIDEENH